MRQLSRYYGLPMRIFTALFLVVYSVLIIKYAIYEGITSGETDLVVIPGLMLIFFVPIGLYVLVKLCDVSTDNEYIYVESLLVKEKISIKNIETFYIDFKGFNVIFLEPTKFGKKIFFAPKPFGKNQTKKLFTDLIKKNRGLRLESKLKPPHSI